jgi:putative effector of murein hydrolase LrgA (UPF0299 family)
MTELLAVAALDLGVVPRLGAITREVTLLLAVAARSVVRVLGLIALLGDVVLRAAVVAGTLSDVGALLYVSDVLLLQGGSTYILGEVASLVALAALDTLSRARLGALLGRVALLLAVPAGVGVDSLFRTVAGAMTSLVTVDALDGRLGRLMLRSLLLAVLCFR